LTANVFNNSEGESMLNSTLTYLKDVRGLLISFRLSPTDLNDLNAVLSIEGKVDTCKIEKGIFGSFIVKIAQDSLAKYSNMKFLCKMPKGFYYCSNLKIDEMLVPIHLFGQKLKFTFDYTIKTRIGNRKSLVELISCQITGIAL